MSGDKDSGDSLDDTGLPGSLIFLFWVRGGFRRRVCVCCYIFAGGWMEI